MKIEVPYFEGFEAFYGVPEEHKDCYVPTCTGDELVHIEEAQAAHQHLHWPQICYRKVKPRRIVLEATGERRPPKEGEWFKDGDGWLVPNDGVYSLSRFEEYEIYRIVEDSEK
jgi:hypothetical protein